LPKLVNLGSLCIDHVYRVTDFAGPGETVSSLSHQVFPGGKGLNQSLAAARAGAEVVHVGCVGEDGGVLLGVLRDADVDILDVRTVPEVASGHAVIQVNDAGQNAIVIAGGANRTIEPKDVRCAIERLAPGDWLLLQNEINDLPAVLDAASSRSARIAFNVAPCDGREQDYDLSAVGLLIVNELEARALVPNDLAAGDDATVATHLAAACPMATVVLTAGSSGLTWVGEGGGEARQLPAFPVAAVDETAAGDAFIGYLLAGLLGGESMERSLQLGAAAGALAVTAAGAGTSIPDRAAVRELISTYL
jgi:ribokinase